MKYTHNASTNFHLQSKFLTFKTIITRQPTREMDAYIFILLCKSTELDLYAKFTATNALKSSQAPKLIKTN